MLLKKFQCSQQRAADSPRQQAAAAESAQTRPDPTLALYAIILCNVEGWEYFSEMQLYWCNPPFRCDCSGLGVPCATPLTLLAGLGKLCGRSTAAYRQFLLVKRNMV